MSDATAVPGQPPNPAAADTAAYPQRKIEAIYRQMLMSLFLATLALVLVLGTLLLIFHFKFQSNDKTSAPSLLLIVMMSGMLGALFSSLIRLYSFKELPIIFLNNNIPALDRWHLLIYGFIPPFVGAIGATVLYLCFAGGMIGGDLFPKFVCQIGDGKCITFEHLIEKFGPGDAKDYAKALVWGFIAGFSERLVPDTLGNFVKAAEKK
jgi:hypothetical protein